MRYCGLGKYVVEKPAVARVLHENFKIFNTAKIKKERGIFKNQFYTDGYSLCFPFKKAAATSHDTPISLHDIEPSMMQYFDVWGIDPGVIEVFVASNSSNPDAYTLETDMIDEPILSAREDKRHQVLKFSAAEFYYSAGYNKITTKIENWKGLHGIITIENTMGSLKIASIARIQEYIVNKMISLDRLLLFYNDDFQKVRFFNYRGKQKAAREMVQIFVEAEHKPKTGKWKKHPFEESNKIPLLCVCDGKFDRRSFCGKPHGLVKIFRKATKLAQRQQFMFVVDVNEQYTLKVCSRGGKRSLDNVRIGDKRRSKLHSVVSFNACHIVWQRDVNASRNIHSLALFEICGLVPDVFTRGRK
ncbi:hypothetical protein BC941DRAFT_518479 [Chlamydoabsidia padenii]|nr:hypothetical protein BC941DRAFT_518479 [Chlamydoabsidia padenii]